MRKRVQGLGPSGMVFMGQRCWAVAALALMALFIFYVNGAAAKERAGITEDEFVSRLKNTPVSIQCEAVDVGLLLRGIARQAGVNIYVPDNLKETITLDFQDVTLYDVFQTILKAKGLTYRFENSVVYIQPTGEKEKGSGRFVARRLEIIVGDAEDYVELLTPLLSSKGRIRSAKVTATNQNQADTGYSLSNTKKYIIVMDEEEIVDRIESMVKKLNRSIGQIYIDARIVAVNKGVIKKLGINWNYQGSGRDTSVSGEFTPALDGVAAFTVGIVRSSFQIDAEIRALQSRDQAKVLSAPKILVLDGESAVIKQGQEVPYVTTNRFGETNVEFKEATLSLSVTPTILPNGYIVLHVAITNDSVNKETLANNYPLLNKESMATSLFLKDGVTVVIGGIQVKSSFGGDVSVPILSKIPVVGRVFHQTTKERDDMELLVFLTPKVLSMHPFSVGMQRESMEESGGGRKKGE